jgi:hypothetical protein
VLISAVLLFAITAVGGLILASKVLGGKFASWTISLLHALAGAAGLILLIIEAIYGIGGSRVTASLALLIMAALGGFYLASYHIREKIAPKGFVIIHASLAVIGFLILLTVLLGI